MTNTMVRVQVNGGETLGQGVLVFDREVVLYVRATALEAATDGQRVTAKVTRRGRPAVSADGTLCVQEHRNGTVRFMGVILDGLDEGPTDSPGEDPGEAKRIQRMLELIARWKARPGIDDPTDDDPIDDDPPLGPVSWVCRVVFRNRC